jgi:hypothetical protein
VSDGRSDRISILLVSKKDQDFVLIYLLMRTHS